ncbi:MAG: DNA polymerase Y family protein [Candidatus Woesebacteria bacterium]|nr:DNA polymerase Y family protein [Candidatus Woesebacteria bacterium]
MLWLALHCPLPASAGNTATPSPDDGPCRGGPVAQSESRRDDFLPTLACWAGRYTPRVNLAPDTLRLDIGASLRLFGGLPALLALVRADLAAMDIPAQLAVAATPLAALWLARAGDGAVCPDLATTRAALAAVPLPALELPPPLARRVEGCGLRRLGDVLVLPRAGLGARFGKPFVLDLARALGEIADPQACFVFPEHFQQALELPAPVEAAPVLLFAARRLIAALSGWLEARNAAVRELEWVIDHGHGVQTPVSLAFSAPVHSAQRIERVFKEQLDTLALSAPALALRLRAPQAEPREARSHALFDGAGQRQEVLAELMDRLVARLGHEAVQGLACHADHRPELASRGSPDKPGIRPAALPPRPLWLLASPEALREIRGRPQCGGALALVAGPERIEAGWWDGADARRDYFIAQDKAGRWLWIFRDPCPPGGWFLHGMFA